MSAEEATDFPLSITLAPEWPLASGPQQVERHIQPNTTEDTTQGQISDSDSNDSTSSGSSIISRTSTQEFHHEPFDMYSLHVKELCPSLWPTTPKRVRNRIKDVFRRKKSLRSLRGSHPNGFQNRIIGIKINQGNTQQTQLVLGVLRHASSKPDREVAIVNFVRRHSSAPVAEVKASYFTRENLLKSPDVMYSRHPGYNLHSGDNSFVNMTHEQQSSVAKDLGRILRSI